MKLNEIVRRVNVLLAGENCTLSELTIHLDAVIDDINAALSSTYPAFSELSAAADVYDAFPDKYIRLVVIPGAAHKYFVADEEGNPSAPQYQQNYADGMFLMVRDWSIQVPEQYQAPTLEGMTIMQSDVETGSVGVMIDAKQFL